MAQRYEVRAALCQVSRTPLPNTTDHESDGMQDLSWQLPFCLQQQIRNVSIFTWITATLRARVSEQQPDEQHLENLTYFPQQQTKTTGERLWRKEHFCKHTFQNEHHPGRQLAREVARPQLRCLNLTLHLLSPRSRLPVLIKQRRLSGRISSARWLPTVRPEHREREGEGICGARFSGLWGVVPQINREIMCKACVPIMRSHFLSKTLGIAYRAVPKVGVPCDMMYVRSIQWTGAGSFSGFLFVKKNKQEVCWSFCTPTAEASKPEEQSMFSSHVRTDGPFPLADYAHFTHRDIYLCTMLHHQGKCSYGALIKLNLIFCC